MMKGLVVLVAIVVLFGAAAAHAGKRLTTGSSGGSSVLECTVVNVSDTKTITVAMRARSISGAVVSEAPGVVLPPLQGELIFGAGDQWCEFVVVSGGSAKDLRASAVMYEAGNVVGSEPAREK
jgi:hypothetical protein